MQWNAPAGYGWVPQVYGGPWGVPGTWQPRVNMYRLKDSILVTADIPGADEKSIDISVENGTLIIQGNATREADYQNVLYRERTGGPFFRSVAIPPGVDPDRASASYKNGVLEVSLPLRPGTGTRGIPVGESQ